MGSHFLTCLFHVMNMITCQHSTSYHLIGSIYAYTALYVSVPTLSKEESLVPCNKEMEKKVSVPFRVFYRHKSSTTEGATVLDAEADSKLLPNENCSKCQQVQQQFKLCASKTYSSVVLNLFGCDPNSGHEDCSATHAFIQFQL